MPSEDLAKNQQKKEKDQSSVEHQRSVGSFFIRYGLLFVVAFLFILFSVLEPQFITLLNVFTIIRQASILGLMALGLTVIVIAGEFDISFVAIATFCGVIPVILIMSGVENLWLVWSIGIACGIAFSLINSVNVISVGIPSFIATLGMMAVLTGISRGFTKGITTYPQAFPPGFGLVGRYMIGGLIPVPVIIFVVVSILLILVLDYSPKGRYVYAIGGNPKASLHVGINVKRIKILAFLIAGVTYGIAGIIMSSMFGSCSPGMGEGYLLPAIISCFLGAAFLTEGVPNPRGTIVSAILLAILSNGFTMTKVPFYGRSIIQGIILLISLGMLVILRKRRQII